MLQSVARDLYIIVWCMFVYVLETDSEIDEFITRSRVKRALLQGSAVLTGCSLS